MPRGQGRSTLARAARRSDTPWSPAQFVISGAFRNVLVVGSDAMSRIIDWRDRGTCVLFGDGAGAAVLTATDRPGGLRSFVLGSDGCGAERLLVPAGRLAAASQPRLRGSPQPLLEDGRPRCVPLRDQGDPWLDHRGAGERLSSSDLALVIPHQANSRMIDNAREKLNLPADWVFMNVDKYGNTSAASIPVAVCEAFEQGRIKLGHIVAMCAFGAGLCWAAAVWSGTRRLGQL